MTKTKLKTKQTSPAWYIARDVMKRKGFTYDQLAEKIGMSPSSTFMIVNRAPSILHVKMLADVMGVPFADFFDFSKKEVPCPEEQ